jgi:hypothetical protein
MSQDAILGGNDLIIKLIRELNTHNTICVGTFSDIAELFNFEIYLYQDRTKAIGDKYIHRMVWEAEDNFQLTLFSEATWDKDSPEWDLEKLPQPFLGWLTKQILMSLTGAMWAG